MLTVNDFKITPTALEAAGYCRVPGNDIFTRSDLHYQKTVRCPYSKYKLYFINFYIYLDKSSYGIYGLNYGVSAKAELYRGSEEDGDWFTVSFHANKNHDIAYVEDFYAVVYRTIPGTVPDVHNND